MDYEVYRLGKREWLLYGSQGVGYLALLDFVFYRSAALFAVLAPMGICYPLILRKDLKRRRKEALKLQFKDAILSAASGLNAGYSVENAFAAALEEMDRLYGKDSMISQELRLILAKTRMNRAFWGGPGGFCQEERPGGYPELFRCVPGCPEKRRGASKDHRQDSGDHSGKDTDPGGHYDGHSSQADGAEDHERHSGTDRFLYRAYVPWFF